MFYFNHRLNYRWLISFSFPIIFILLMFYFWNFIIFIFFPLMFHFNIGGNSPMLIKLNFINFLIFYSFFHCIISEFFIISILLFSAFYTCTPSILNTVFYNLFIYLGFSILCKNFINHQNFRWCTALFSFQKIKKEVSEPQSNKLPNILIFFHFFPTLLCIFSFLLYVFLNFFHFISFFCTPYFFINPLLFLLY